MRWRSKLSTKLLLLGITLLLLALLSIGLTMRITWQLDGGAAAVNEAGRLRMQAWRLTSAYQGGRSATELQAMVREFERSLVTLREGDAQRPLFVPWDADSRTRFEALMLHWQRLRPHWLQAQGLSLAELTGHTDGFVDQLDQLVISIERTLSKLTAVLNLAQFLMMAFAVLAAVLSLYVGYMFVIHPLLRLQHALARVEGGDFSIRVEVDARDEFGELALGFNHMASTLHAMYQSLESKVQEKTRALQGKTERLAALYEVSTFLAESHSLEELAKGFAQKIRRLSGADAVAVRWSDEASQRYLMLGSDCLPQALVQEERCLEPGLCACGQPQATAHTRVIPIVAEPEGRMGMCARVGYSHLVSVPIRLQHRVLGEVDLFFRSDVALQDDDRGLYDALVSHLASAIETLRTDALMREAAVGEERALLARELHDSIAQSLAFLKIQISLLRGALPAGDALRIAELVDGLDEGVQESTNDVRELLLHFRTRTHVDDIEQSLRTTLRKFEHQSGVKTHLQVHGHAVALPPDVQLQVLHIVQEALSNVRKHARASEVFMTVDKGPVWLFRVRDNGLGFAARPAQDTDTHVGLHIMRERAHRIGAEVALRSVPGQGTEMELRLTGRGEHP